MFKIGDMIIYGKSGVCEIEDFGKVDMDCLNAEKEYYTLSPLNSEGRIFTPSDTKVSMRHIITEAEARELIESIPSLSENICNNNHPRVLKEYYNQFLATNDSRGLMELLKNIYLKNTKAIQNGKSLSQTDVEVLRKIEDQLFGEFSVALGISIDKVKSQIEDRLKEIISES